MAAANGCTIKLKKTAKHYFFFLLWMLVNTCEKSKRQNLKFVYTLHLIVVSQTALPVLQYVSHSKQHAYQCVQHLGILFEQATMVNEWGAAKVITFTQFAQYCNIGSLLALYGPIMHVATL